MEFAVQVKILNEDDFLQIEKIYYDNFEAVSQRHLRKTGSQLLKDELYHHMTTLWFDALKKYYLNQSDMDHILMGLLDKDILHAYVAIRFDLPEGWDDGWVVSYLKADPNFNIISNGGLRKLWLDMFTYAESRNKVRWHTITEKKRHSAFDAFGIKVVPEINNRYDYFTTCDIPAGTKSNIDWVFAMMGRIVHYDKDYIVRTGILKPEFR